MLPLHRLVSQGDHWQAVDAIASAIASAHARDEAAALAAVNAGDPSLAGTTPLLLSIRLGHSQVARALLDGGADPSRPGAWQLTPLMYCAVWGRAELVQELLARGADVSAEDVNGKTALWHAQSEGQHDIAALIGAAVPRSET
eukprot:SAG22_NODE_3091_length_1948_cov_1.918334_1_plen_143_part_00